MTIAALLGTLAVLALVDSTSLGTLVIPVWLLLSSRRPPVGRILLYLGVVAGLYFLLGTAVLLGAGALLAGLGDGLGAGLESTPAYVLQVVVGVGLLVLSFVIEPADVGARRRARRAARRGGGGAADSPADRRRGWRERITGSPRAVVGVALAAVALEVATMLPYLGAIGLLTAHAPSLPAALGLLAGYCLAMVLPALALLGLRLVAAERIDPLLRRVDAWASRSGASTVAWILGILGAVLAVQGVGVLAQRGMIG